MDVFSIVTEKILAELEAGVVPWHKPWKVSGRPAFNRFSGKEYSFLNQMLLLKGGEYASFKQWSAIGGKIKNGAKSEMVVFWKFPEKDEKKTSPADPVSEGEEDDEKRKKRSQPVLRYYNVFHVSQVEGVEPLIPEKENEVPTAQPIALAEKVISDYIQREGISFEAEKSDKAYYSPTQDLVHVPHIQQYDFSDVEKYYSTVVHELVHSTGHMNRLCREGLKNVMFGSETYSKEELIAEIGSAAILNSIGIETEATLKNSAAYIASWLEVLKNDKRMIVFAAGQAEKAVNMILSK